MKKKAWLFALATIVLPLVLANAAWAHSLGVEAQAVCDPSTGSVTIQYYVYNTFSWYPPQGENSQIQVLVNDVLVATGAFQDPVYSFSGSTPAPQGAGPGDLVVVTARAAAKWGDGADGGQSASVTVTIPDACTSQPGLGRFTGGGHQVRVDDVRVERGLTIHCDLLLSNNLEVNWQGNSFHMLEHMTTVACSDDPAIVQFPPAAPLDTLVGIGIGRFNNVDGYTIEFTLVDAGEPGVNDMARLFIYETANPANVVLNVPLQKLTGGNLQAHYDQPHK